MATKHLTVGRQQEQGRPIVGGEPVAHALADLHCHLDLHVSVSRWLTSSGCVEVHNCAFYKLDAYSSSRKPGGSSNHAFLANLKIVYAHEPFTLAFKHSKKQEKRPNQSYPSCLI